MFFSKSLDWDAEEFLKWDESKNYIFPEPDNGDASEPD